MSQLPACIQYLSRTPPTHWSAVQRLSQPVTRLELEADAFVKIYWGPLYAEARKCGVSHEQAVDSAQEVMSKLFGKGELARVRQERGRLRDYLRTLVQNECNRVRRRESALKRGGGAAVFSLDGTNQERLRDEWQEVSSREADPMEMSRLLWAQNLFDLARNVIDRRYKQRGKGREFDGLVRSLAGLNTRIGYRELGSELGVTEACFAQMVRRFRSEFGEVLRAVVSETFRIPPGPELDEEIRALFRLCD